MGDEQRVTTSPSPQFPMDWSSLRLWGPNGPSRPLATLPPSRITPRRRLWGSPGTLVDNVVYYVRPDTTSELWAYDGVDWSLQGTTGALPRDPVSAAFDGHTRRLVVWAYAPGAEAVLYEAQFPVRLPASTALRGVRISGDYGVR